MRTVTRICTPLHQNRVIRELVVYPIIKPNLAQIFRIDFWWSLRLWINPCPLERSRTSTFWSRVTRKMPSPQNKKLQVWHQEHSRVKEALSREMEELRHQYRLFSLQLEFLQRTTYRSRTFLLRIRRANNIKVITTSKCMEPKPPQQNNIIKNQQNKRAILKKQSKFL